MRTLNRSEFVEQASFPLVEAICRFNLLEGAGVEVTVRVGVRVEVQV